ncbi:hypothetical protein [Streptomyces sp. SID12488]|uniref:hypothetical protein n=1 Tax=Streptomyces sp. SID12488 TaxID=2706040 RepID=UPI0013DCF831|nr:hypothetical protein [Streptomyces sp. SID12488]NEA66617.1 hypothetical protein [Streptomyces sp. SID12488]
MRVVPRYHATTCGSLRLRRPQVVAAGARPPPGMRCALGTLTALGAADATGDLLRLLEPVLAR